MTKKQILKFFTKLKFKDYVFEVKFRNAHSFTVFITANLLCSDTGKNTDFTDFNHYKMAGVTEALLLSTIRDWLHTAAMHEVDEHIRFEGKKVYDPHAAKTFLF